MSNRHHPEPQEMNVLTQIMLFWAGTWYKPVIGFFGATLITMLLSHFVLGNPFSIDMALRAASGPLFVIAFALVLKWKYGEAE